MNLLAVDVGNTTINFGLIGNGKLRAKTKVLTAKFTKVPFNNYDDVIIASVVPDATKKIVQQLKVKPTIVDYKNVPIKIKVKNPSQVGADRLVNAVAVKELYGTPSVVVDFGTATTFDVVSKNGEYIGGVIAPGVKIAVESLFEKTAKLPKIDIHTPKNVIGKNTKEAMLSGVFYGHVGLIREVVKQISNYMVVLTGGYADFFSSYFPEFRVDKDLTLKGLKIIFDKSSSREKLPLMGGVL